MTRASSAQAAVSQAYPQRRMYSHMDVADIVLVVDDQRSVVPR